jgi:hypothetical protein
MGQTGMMTFPLSSTSKIHFAEICSVPGPLADMLKALLLGSHVATVAAPTGSVLDALALSLVTGLGAVDG